MSLPKRSAHMATTIHLLLFIVVYPVTFLLLLIEWWWGGIPSLRHLTSSIATKKFEFLSSLDFRWWTERKEWRLPSRRGASADRKGRKRAAAGKANSSKSGARNTSGSWPRCSAWPNRIANSRWCTCRDCRPPRRRRPDSPPKRVTRRAWNAAQPSWKWSSRAAAPTWRVTWLNSTGTATSTRESTSIRADRTCSTSRADSSRNFYVHSRAASSSSPSPTPSSLIIRQERSGGSTTFASATDAPARSNRRKQAKKPTTNY